MSGKPLLAASTQTGDKSLEVRWREAEAKDYRLRLGIRLLGLRQRVAAFRVGGLGLAVLDEIGEVVGLVLCSCTL
jgi:hypothetical protein